MNTSGRPHAGRVFEIYNHCCHLKKRTFKNMIFFCVKASEVNYHYLQFFISKSLGLFIRAKKSLSSSLTELLKRQDLFFFVRESRLISRRRISISPSSDLPSTLFRRNSIKEKVDAGKTSAKNIGESLTTTNALREEEGMSNRRNFDWIFVLEMSASKTQFQSQEKGVVVRWFGMRGGGGRM